MNTKEWGDVKKELLYGFVGSVKLKIDGYEVHLIREPISELKDAIWVHVNGTNGVKLAISESDEANEIKRRFFCPKIEYLYDRKKLEKAPKKVKEAFEAEKSKYTYEYFQPWWTSFTQMKRHFEKNNTSIQIERFGIDADTD